jgi:hypothetical protein
MAVVDRLTAKTAEDILLLDSKNTPEFQGIAAWLTGTCSKNAGHAIDRKVLDASFIHEVVGIAPICMLDQFEFQVVDC